MSKNSLYLIKSICYNPKFSCNFLLLAIMWFKPLKLFEAKSYRVVSFNYQVLPKECFYFCAKLSRSFCKCKSLHPIHQCFSTYLNLCPLFTDFVFRGPLSTRKLFLEISSTKMIILSTWLLKIFF